jgi:hypothetical protein
MASDRSLKIGVVPTEDHMSFNMTSEMLSDLSMSLVQTLSVLTVPEFSVREKPRSPGVLGSARKGYRPYLP